MVLKGNRYRDEQGQLLVVTEVTPDCVAYMECDESEARPRWTSLIQWQCDEMVGAIKEVEE